MTKPSLFTLPLLALALALAGSTVACGGMQIALQEPVSAATPTPIEGKGKELTMAGVTITRTKGGAVTKFSGSAGPWGGEKIKQNFEYQTSDGWAGACAFATGGQSIGGIDIAANGGMKCNITKDGQTWVLDLAAVSDGGKRLVGTYGNGSSSFDVRMSKELEGSGFPMFIGYDVRSGGTGVAAVQVAGTRQMWLVDGTPDGDALGAAVGAMVFSYQAVQQATQ